MDMEMPTMEDADPRQQLETFKQNDAYNQLLTFTERLVTKVTELSTQLDQVTGDLEDQNSIRRDWKRRAEAAEIAITKNPFVLVLIDGDGYIFQDSYLKNLDSGGGIAAHRLLSEVKRCIDEVQSQSSSSEYQVMVNVFANKRGLTGALLEGGVIPHPSQLEEFFCRFTQSQAHFQFIDCGTGKERVDVKLRETYRFYLQNCQCRLICLALCHDNGYIAELDKYRNDTTAKQKTWLVDHHAKGRGFLDPPFHMVKFDEIFSTKALYVKRITASSSLTNKSSSYSSAMTNSFSVEQAPRSEQSPFFMLDRQPRYAHGAESPSGTQSEPQQNLTPGPRTPFFAPELATPAVGDQVIPVNLSNQRIDLPIPLPSPLSQRNFESRVARHKLCNEHYLRNSCTEFNCHFDHSAIDDDLEITLRYTARKKPCRSGVLCRRLDCYYGHHCPFANCDSRRCPFAKAGLHEVEDLEMVGFVAGGG